MFSAVSIGVVLVLGAVLLFVLPRAIRLLFRLIMVGVIVILILAGLGYYWWNHSESTTTPRESRPPAARRSPSR
jgi:hypothetical protein